LTSERKIRANRANAQASTGPKTADGRARVARNALRHALSLPVCSDPALSQDVETLACEIAGLLVNTKTQQLARKIAEAQIDLRRVRYARHQLLSRAFADPYYESRADRRQKEAILNRLLLKNALDLAMKAVEILDRPSTLEGPDKFSTICHKRPNNYWRWTAMNGERYPGESLPFEPSMRHADGRLIAIIERADSRAWTRGRHRFGSGHAACCGAYT
jgi:hypothetical protein